jgi:hypothetical protein
MKCIKRCWSQEGIKYCQCISWWKLELEDVGLGALLCMCERGGTNLCAHNRHHVVADAIISHHIKWEELIYLSSILIVHSRAYRTVKQFIYNDHFTLRNTSLLWRLAVKLPWNSKQNDGCTFSTVIFSRIFEQIKMALMGPGKDDSLKKHGVKNVVT